MVELNAISEAKDLLTDACLDFQHFFNGDCKDADKFMQGLHRVCGAIKFLEKKT